MGFGGVVFGVRGCFFGEGLGVGGEGDGEAVERGDRVQGGGG